LIDGVDKGGPMGGRHFIQSVEQEYKTACFIQRVRELAGEYNDAIVSFIEELRSSVRTKEQ